MPDLSRTTGPAAPSAAKRAGNGHAGANRNAAKAGARGLDGQARRDGSVPSGGIVVPSSDFEGFGSFSS